VQPEVPDLPPPNDDAVSSLSRSSSRLCDTQTDILFTRRALGSGGSSSSSNRSQILDKETVIDYENLEGKNEAESSEMPKASPQDYYEDVIFATGKSITSAADGEHFNNNGDDGSYEDVVVKPEPPKYENITLKQQQVGG
jgi:hypothetical protein